MHFYVIFLFFSKILIQFYDHNKSLTLTGHGKPKLQECLEEILTKYFLQGMQVGLYSTVPVLYSETSLIRTTLFPS